MEYKKVRIIDYADVRTTQDLINWAIKTFNMPPNQTTSSPDRFLGELFDHIGRGGVRYEIEEKNVDVQTDEVRYILQEAPLGWRYALSFHLVRDHGVGVRFRR